MKSINIKRFSRISIVHILMLAAFFTFQEKAMAGNTGKISGRIINAETGEPLIGVNVLLEQTTLGAATDNDGDYFIINIIPGTYSVIASMIGYASVTVSQIEVFADHTTPVNFELILEAVRGETVTIMAEREIVKMDMSSSIVAATAEEVINVPLVTDVREFVNLQAGIDGWEVRGGSADETAFMMDGLMMVDNRMNQPFATPNLSSVKEVDVIKGGFNAEYGNVRSGVINIITREGSPDAFHGSVDIRMTPPQVEHSGYPLYDHRSWYVRPFLELEDSVCYKGTSAWPDSLQLKYVSFNGWNNDPAVKAGDLTAEERRNLFIWRHRLEGADELAPEGYDGKPRVGTYGDKWDYLADIGFGGPVPFVKGLTFFLSHRTNLDPFALPTQRDYYKAENSQLRLTYRAGPNIKLGLTGLYGEVNSIAQEAVLFARGTAQRDNYLTSGNDILYRGFDENFNKVYYPQYLAPFDVSSSMIGVSFEHMLSPSTFYNIRVTHTTVKNNNDGPRVWRDTTTIRYFGDIAVDEIPYGYLEEPRIQSPIGGIYLSYRAGMNRDYSDVETINIKADFTSQINKFHQLKAGIEYNSDHILADYGAMRGGDPFLFKYHVNYDQTPIRAAGYLQDKIEFEGIIANVGLRADYSNANTDWFTADIYSPWFNSVDLFAANAPTEPAKTHLKISPRFGISHPISDNTKLFFNYGWFHSMTTSDDLYQIHYAEHETKVRKIGNPSAELPKTVAYELGFEQDIADMLLVRIMGYYKDVSDETGTIQYTNYDETVDYQTIDNTHYADTRGFEIELQKRVGRWVTGWLNYDYMVTTEGYIGREHYYENPIDQRRYGLQNPYQERPHARPVFRGKVNFMTPMDWGAALGGWSADLLYSWRAGAYMTWDPLDLKLRENLQRKSYHMLDGRLSKQVNIGGFDVTLFADIHNILDTKRLNLDQATRDADDREVYLESLHLPMYKDEEYIGYWVEHNPTTGEDVNVFPAGYKGDIDVSDRKEVEFNDQVGDVKGDDKPYINMPDIDTLWYSDPRSVTIGLRINF